VRPILSDRLTCIGTSPRFRFLEVGNGGALTVPTCETGPVLSSCLMTIEDFLPDLDGNGQPAEQLSRPVGRGLW
jgi:hypothetical protein